MSWQRNDKRNVKNNQVERWLKDDRRIYLASWCELDKMRMVLFPHVHLSRSFFTPHGICDETAKEYEKNDWILCQFDRERMKCDRLAVCFASFDGAFLNFAQIFGGRTSGFLRARIWLQKTQKIHLKWGAGALFG